MKDHALKPGNLFLISGKAVERVKASESKESVP